MLYMFLCFVVWEDVFLVVLLIFVLDCLLRLMFWSGFVYVVKCLLVKEFELLKCVILMWVGCVCGDCKIQGLEIGNVSGKLSGCGICNVVKVYEVVGVKFSMLVLMNCDMVKMFKFWVEGGMV